MSTDTAVWTPSRHDRDAFARAAAVHEHPAPMAAVTLSRAMADVTLAADDMIRGVRLVKPGTFNGYFEVTRDDLDAWVERFRQLYPHTFEPPMRLNHSWNIEAVLAWFTELRVENVADESNGGTVVPMLTGDMQLVGTPEENARVRAWIKSGKLKKVSSEFGPYRTNAGAEYPSVFAGAAFVDIPAAEGLGGIELRRATLSATDDTPEGTSMGTEQTSETGDVQSTAVETTAGDVASAAVEATVEPPAPPASDPEPVAEPGSLVLGDEPPADDGEGDDEPPTGEVPPAVDLRSAAATMLRSRGIEGTDLEAALRQLDEEVDRRAALRIEATTRLDRHTQAGVIPLALRDRVAAALSHEDPAVRDTIDALLSAAKPPVRLNGAPVTRSSGSPVGERTTIALDATPEEVADIWSSADAAQRVELRKEYDAWQAAQQ